MKYLLILLLFLNSKQAFFVACRLAEPTQVIWTDYDAQWPIIWGDGDVYIQQMRLSESRRGVETNIYQGE